MLLKIIWESTIQAMQQLLGNKLRTFLSLLGIMIGIWCIISVLSAVDSMKYSISNSFNELGEDVVYVDVFPWGADPGENWAKYMARPQPNYSDYKSIVRNTKSAEVATFAVISSARLIEYRSSNVEGAFMMGVTYEYADEMNMDFKYGRYFSQTEHRNGGNQVVLGYEIAEGLFVENMEQGIGKRIKLLGRKMTVIGILEKEGNDLINPLDFDKAAVFPYQTAKSLLNTKSRFTRGLLSVKAAEGVSLEQLQDELRGILRSERRLKPKQEDNFELNYLSIVTKLFDQLFGVMTIAGWFIGAFSIVVGMFSVANIMFVSVKERTSIIGVKKALGAKKYVILLEFLIESIILCLIGGALGLLMVYLAALGATKMLDFPIFLSYQNVLLGTGLSMFIGILAGLIPAMMAARLDPVDAMRQ